MFCNIFFKVEAVIVINIIILTNTGKTLNPTWRIQGGRRFNLMTSFSRHAKSRLTFDSYISTKTIKMLAWRTIRISIIFGDTPMAEFLLSNECLFRV